jgi:hypothetical protein
LFLIDDGRVSLPGCSTSPREISYVRGWPEPVISRKRTPDGDAWARSLGAGPIAGPWTACQACGEDGGERGIPENHEQAMTLWLCDACSCGHLEGGADLESCIERYLDSLYLKGFERAELRERILEARERLGLDDRGMRVDALLASG